jgi:hypothetical protein
MPHQNHHQQLLDILSQVKNTAIQSKYNDLVENIIEQCLHTIDSDDNTDTDMSDLESDFALFGFPLARQVLCISFTLSYIFTLDFPWLGKCCVLVLP